MNFSEGISKFVSPAIALLSLALNVFLIFYFYPVKEKEIFIERAEFRDIVLNTVREHNGATEEELYKKAMEKYPKKDAEYIKMNISNTITDLRKAYLIEKKSDKKYVEPMAPMEMMDDYIKRNFNILETEKLKRNILDRVTLIIFNEPHKYTVQDLYKKIVKDIKVELDFFTMVIYENMKVAQQFNPFPYLGYFMDSEGKLCHAAATAAAMRAAQSTPAN